MYLFLLIVGGALLALSLHGGLHDLDVALDHDVGDSGGLPLVRTAVMAAAFGGLAQLSHLAPARVHLTAASGAAIAAGLTLGLFRLAVRRGELGARAAPLVGRVGRVLVPPAPGRPGTVEVPALGQLNTFLATSAEPLRPGDPVLVIAHARGRVEVARWDGLLPEPFAAREAPWNS